MSEAVPNFPPIDAQLAVASILESSNAEMDKLRVRYDEEGLQKWLDLLQWTKVTSLYIEGALKTEGGRIQLLNEDPASAIIPALSEILLDFTPD